MQSCESIPWQLLWKNPELHQARPCTAARSSSIPHELPHESVVAAAAAHLTAAEYSCCLNLLKDAAQLNNDGASISTTEGETSSLECTSSRGLVHVQLCDRRDALILQLIDATANTIVLEQYLQWPTSASRKLGSYYGILQDVVFCRVVSPSNTTPSGATKNVATRNAIKRQSSQDVSDALDTLHLLSLGMSHTNPTNPITNSTSEENNYVNMLEPRECVEIATDMDSLTMASKNTRVSDFSTSLASDEEELLLLCVLQTDGVIHWYDAINLLLQESKQKNPKKNDAESFASFFLGESLLSIIHEHVLPLSSTYATIHLSLMKGSPRMDESNPKHQKEQRIRSPLLHLDLVDASIEPTPSSKRTYANEITCCVATKEYLVVGGCGKRRAKAPRKAKGVNTKGTSEVSNAGWVTFISLRPELNFAQIKSIYLPFALKSLHYVTWEKMDLVLAMSTSSQHHRSKHRLLAIRIDAGLSPIPCNIPSPRLSQYSSFADMLGQTQASQQPPADDFSGVTIRRFECISIRMDNLHPQSLASDNPFDTDKVRKEDIPMAELSVSVQSATPGIIAVYKCTKMSAENFVFVELQSFQPLELTVDKNVVLPAKRLHGHVAMIEYPHVMTSTIFPSSSKHVSMVGCVSGRGWTLLCLQDDAKTYNCDTFFICWEGQKQEGYSFSQRMSFVRKYNGTLIPNPSMRLVVNVLPEKMALLRQSKKAKARSDSYASDGIPSIPTDHSYVSTQTSYSASLKSKKKIKDDIIDENDEYCSAASILTLSDRDSPKKRSDELLASVDSWKRLDGPSSQEWGVQVAKEILQCNKNGVIILSQRLASTYPQNSYQSDCGSQYETILAWLCREKRDFFMAAYICLLILGDIDCVKQLQRLSIKTNFNFDDLSSFETRTHQHILDGIEADPCFVHRDFVNIVEDKVWNRPSNRISHLSDLALVCLVKGGKRIFPALCTFLKRNSYFGTNRAFKILLGLFLKQLELYYHQKKVNVPFTDIIEDLLWPVESILCIAVARNHMEEALLLLEAAAPTELRGSIDENLCASLVKTIVQSTVYAPTILLSLTLTTEDGVQQRYWNTVSHYLKLKLSLLYFDEHFPMLLIGEIRSWILDEMYQAIESCANAVDDLDRVPTNWLCSLCVACLSNSKCAWKQLTASKLFQAAKIHLSSEWSDPFANHLELYCFENDILDGAFSSPFDLNKLDLDLAIPALLTLEYRGQKWDNDCIVSTQMLLNHICKLALGRPTISTFTFQVKTVMKQCGKIGNVEAAANLIGGRYGFILRCCHIIRLKFPEIKMEDAEYMVLCGDGIFGLNIEFSSGISQSFSLLHYHHKVLQMLYDHVLSVTKFGDFDPSCTSKRGVISPVFASRLCLRLWLILTVGGTRRECSAHPSPTKATEFLEEWLKCYLRLDEEGSTNVLACAALCRAVLWPAESDYDNECLSGPAASVVLAEELNFSSQFLFSLTKSCRGLMEPLPFSVVEKSFIGYISSV